MDVHNAPTVIVRSIVPRKHRASPLHRIAVFAVMLMLFELGLALGGYRARRPRSPVPVQVTAIARPTPIVLEPIELTPTSVVTGDGARVRASDRAEDSAVR